MLQSDLSPDLINGVIRPS